MTAPNKPYQEVVVLQGTTGASGQSAILPGFGPYDTIRMVVNVTAASGTTPTLDVVLEDSVDGVTWTTVNVADPVIQKTGVAVQAVNVESPFADRLRVRWTVGGTTPSFTFAVVLVVQTAAT
jgi:hypothetical protein